MRKFIAESCLIACFIATVLTDHNEMDTLIERRFEKFNKRYKERTLLYLENKYPFLDEHARKDILQDAYIALFNNITEGKVNGLIYPYFLKICRNLCLKKHRHDSAHIVVGIQDDEDIFQDNKVSMKKVDQILQIKQEEDEAIEEKKNMVGMALEKMAVKCQMLLWSYYADELSWATIASMFGLKNADSAKTSASRCRKKFKEKFHELKKEQYGK